MNFLESVILGLIEGLTEFLPISSTFHLILASRLLKIPADEFNKLFSIFIQSGAILAVVFLYIRKVARDFELAMKTIVAFVPTGLMGLILYRLIKQVFFESYFAMISIFIVIGLLFFLFELLVKVDILRPEKSLVQLTYLQAFLIGLVQSLSFMPGVSRAGAVILTMMALGYRRSDSAYFSFILSIPTIFAATLFDLYKSRDAFIHSESNIFLLALGFITAFTVAFFAVKWFIAYLQKHTMNLFAAYRFIAGVIVLALILSL